MSLLRSGAVPALIHGTRRPRHVYLDNLKVVLVVGVIVAHVTMAWTGVGTWVFEEPHVREPMLSILTLAAVFGSLFGMALFFLIAGMFTPASLARKGFGPFALDRAVRLGVPMVFYILAFSPVVEYVDPDNAHWDKGFAAFTVHVWWPPAPGPTWFLGVLLLFSVVYAAIRTVSPTSAAARTAPTGAQLLIAGAIIAIASYALHLAVPLGRSGGISRSGRRRPGPSASAWAYSVRSGAGSIRSMLRSPVGSGTSRGQRSRDAWPWSVWPARWEQTSTLSAAAAPGSHCSSPCSRGFSWSPCRSG